MPNRAVNLRVKPSHLASFTLVELLTVMAIIAILSALTLAAGSMVMMKAGRSRAASEIQAMSTALEGYKTDNGIYPLSDGVNLLTNTPYTLYDGTSTQYQTNATVLYTALSGQNYYSTTTFAGKSYMSFKANQVGNPGGPFSYVRDPWGYAYGYSTGTPAGAATTNAPYNGSGFFDIWSTASLTLPKSTNTAAWVNNWQ